MAVPFLSQRVARLLRFAPATRRCFELGASIERRLPFRFASRGNPPEAVAEIGPGLVAGAADVVTFCDPLAESATPLH